MPANSLSPTEKKFVDALGKKISRIVLKDMKYRSIDQFCLEHSDEVSKPTLYQICKGKSDMKLTSLLRIASALGMTLQELIADIKSS